MLTSGADVVKHQHTYKTNMHKTENARQRLVQMADCSGACPQGGELSCVNIAPRQLSPMAEKLWS